LVPQGIALGVLFQRKPADRVCYRDLRVVVFFFELLKRIRIELFRDDVLSLRTFLPLGHFHSDLLPFFQSLESFHLDCGVMYEYILTTFTLDEAKTLIVIEPLDGPFYSFT
jgi:hypothetical protein